MMKRICKFLSAILVVGLTLLALSPSYADVLDINVGDYGAWNTEANQQMVINNVSKQLQNFQNNFSYSPGFVPIEAKIGLSFMNALSHVGNVLDSTLGQFVIIFIVIMYAFWIGLEAYNLINGKAEVKKQVEEIVKKGILIAIWIVILRYGIRDTFMMVMGPVISLGTYLSDLMFGSIVSGFEGSIPDTCSAIKNYVSASSAAGNLLNEPELESLLCIATRISGFCYTAIGVGFDWMSHGIGGSVFGFLAGLAFVVGFVWVAWKYAFMALGVIADLFFGLMLLPFTAIAETTGKTSYKGIFGEIYGGFLKLFNTESLQKQIGRFINTVVFFVTFSIVVAFSAAMLSGVISADSGNRLPELDGSFISTALTGVLVFYLATKAEEITKKIGGEIDASMGEKARGYVQEFSLNTYKKVRKFFKKE